MDSALNLATVGRASACGGRIISAMNNGDIAVLIGFVGSIFDIIGTLKANLFFGAKADVFGRGNKLEILVLNVKFLGEGDFPCRS